MDGADAGIPILLLLLSSGETTDILAPRDDADEGIYTVLPPSSTAPTRGLQLLPLPPASDRLRIVEENEDVSMTAHSAVELVVVVEGAKVVDGGVGEIDTAAAEVRWHRSSEEEHCDAEVDVGRADAAVTSDGDCDTALDVTISSEVLLLLLLLLELISLIVLLAGAVTVALAAAAESALIPIILLREAAAVLPLPLLLLLPNKRVNHPDPDLPLPGRPAFHSKAGEAELLLLLLPIFKLPAGEGAAAAAASEGDPPGATGRARAGAAAGRADAAI